MASLAYFETQQWSNPVFPSSTPTKAKHPAFALWLIMFVALSLTHETVAGVPFACVGALLVIVVLYRYGLLALISSIFFLHLVIFYPITSDLSAWYAADFVLALIICLALVGFGFYTSLAGQPLFKGALPED